MPYARDTTVGPDRTRIEIERLLARYGATAFSYAYDTTGTQKIEFVIDGRHMRMMLPIPPLEDFAFTPTRMRREKAPQRAAWEKSIRERWRALLLIIKAKLVAVESGITTVEREFLADVVVPASGMTFGEHAAPELAKQYGAVQAPALTR